MTIDTASPVAPPPCLDSPKALEDALAYLAEIDRTQEHLRGLGFDLMVDDTTDHMYLVSEPDPDYFDVVGALDALSRLGWTLGDASDDLDLEDGRIASRVDMGQ